MICFRLETKNLEKKRNKKKKKKEKLHHILLCIYNNLKFRRLGFSKVRWCFPYSNIYNQPSILIQELIKNILHLCSAVLSHTYRSIQGRDHIRGIYQPVTGPRQHFRMENGGIVLAKNLLHENNITSSIFQSPQLSQRPFDFKPTFSR